MEGSVRCYIEPISESTAWTRGEDEELVRGDPRGPGGPPHNYTRIPAMKAFKALLR